MACLNTLVRLIIFLVAGGIVRSSLADDTPVTPVIGVLVQEVYKDGLISRHFEGITSYIAASYVKYLEGAGARVVPIWIGRNRTYYDQLLVKINGVLLPGGATWFNQSGGYADAGEYLIQGAMELNDRGVFMPIWGTCLGMELLIFKMANEVETRIDCSSQGQSLPLEFKLDYKESRLFASASDNIITIHSKENVTYNWHKFCYTEEDFSKYGLNESWRVMSVSHDWNNIEFISTVEHRIYPFYGVQFHPEKPLYEFTKASIPHTSASILSGQYFANFFVNEARRNLQKYSNTVDLDLVLIYNFKPEYTSVLGSSYTQQYLFSDGDMGIGDGDDDDDGTSYYPYPNNDDGAATQFCTKTSFLLIITVAVSRWLS
ncbi:uncharacterized protein Dwil_GK16552 [Drosophila willistoni]|uniref:folate gamma-glutamyl hydrolase n=1 Tax=Drosophila willistoni TaxID=7260 RepID=B4MN79_DROWI|nr:gamma-glutamyl hydrolase A [Drosophila willistoni]EDW73635.1 uncharacterized protein Dwil_GK16552 [Drosophila willistoni]